MTDRRPSFTLASRAFRIHRGTAAPDQGVPCDPSVSRRSPVRIWRCPATVRPSGPSRIAEARSAEEIRRGLRMADSRSSRRPERTNREPVLFPGSSLRRTITDPAHRAPKAPLIPTSTAIPVSAMHATPVPPCGHRPPIDSAQVSPGLRRPASSLCPRTRVSRKEFHVPQTFSHLPARPCCRRCRAHYLGRPWRPGRVLAIQE